MSRFIVSKNRVRVLGFEPRTSALSELRSSQLSYTPLTKPQVFRLEARNARVFRLQLQGVTPVISFSCRGTARDARYERVHAAIRFAKSTLLFLPDIRFRAAATSFKRRS